MNKNKVEISQSEQIILNGITFNISSSEAEDLSKQPVQVMPLYVPGNFAWNPVNKPPGIVH